MAIDDAGLEYVQTSMSSREVEGGVDKFLNGLVDGGKAAHGVVLVKSLPSSKARKYPAHALSQRISLLVRTYRGSGIASSPGTHTLNYEERLEKIAWVRKVEEAGGEVTMPELADWIRGDERFGEHCAGVKSTPQGLRQALEINSFPITISDGPFRERCQRAGAADFYSSYITVSTPGSILPVQTSVANLTTIFFHHRGSPMRWVVVPPRAKAAFETRVRLELGEGQESGGCSQFIRHSSLWIDPETLRGWGIDFVEVTQNVYQVLFLLPGCYFYGYSTGFSIIESKVHAGERWAYGSEYRFCDARRKSCRRDGIMVRFGEDAEGGSEGLRKRKRNAFEEGRGQDGAHGRSASVPATDEGDTILVTGEGRDCSSPVVGDDGFNMSDDEERSNGRLLQLQQENTSLVRDLAAVRSERDQLVLRKAMYKSRLVEREGVISSLERTVKELREQLTDEMKRERLRPWQEIMAIAGERISELQQASDGVDRTV